VLELKVELPTISHGVLIPLATLLFPPRVPYVRHFTRARKKGMVSDDIRLVSEGREGDGATDPKWSLDQTMDRQGSLHARGVSASRFLCAEYPGAPEA
jgi:hypothetical protein